MSSTKTSGYSNPFNIDVSKMWGEMKVPAIDMAPMMDLQRRNIEALTSANQVAIEGMQTWARRQMELVKESMEGCTTIVSEITAAGTPEEKIVKQMEMMKQAYENCLSNLKEMQELAMKSNGEAMEVITERVADSIEEIKSVAKKSVKSKVTA